ncbi:MAG: FKBP-type peptidyl-prolyl cis-trans isomerase [Alteromonadaceae bacterium]|jgi:FKBP-type peptidyl-prolyl cis-trans isomerase
MKWLKIGLVMVALLSSINAWAVLDAKPPENVKKPPADAVAINDGIHYIVIKKGMGRLVQKQFVKSLSTGWTSVNGKTQFNAEEDGYDVSDPQTIVRMTPGMATAMKATPLGEKRRWWIPAKLMLPGWRGMEHGNYTVDIEVIEEVDPLPAPANLITPPANAIVKKSGLKYVILKQGKNTEKPSKTNKVRVHYSGWTADGKMFDSSVLRNKTLEFELSRVIKGWREGLQYMSVGDEYRFWVPYRMGYGRRPRPGAPAGNLVFDVELFEIMPGNVTGAAHSAPFGD